MPDELADNLIRIAEGLATRRNFSGYGFRDDLVGEALVKLVAAVEKFNPKTGASPFSYLHRCGWNAFLKTINSEAKQARIREAVICESAISTW